jgi:radical SAM enzyme (rSAM/lipoprotein system)
MKYPSLGIRKWVALELFRRYRKNETKNHYLQYIFWETTLRCNLTCRHCGSDCRIQSDVPDMPGEDFLEAIDKIRHLVDPHKTMIVFTGGEPLLRKDLEEVGLELYKREFPWGLTTQGMLLGKERFKSLLEAGLSAMTISLDGLEESHNWLRGNTNSYRKAIEAIKLAAGAPDLRFDIVSCVHPGNLGELPLLKDLLISLGVKEWRIFTVFPVGRADGTAELKLNADQFIQLMDFIRSTRLEKAIQLNYGCEGYLGAYEGEVRDQFFFCRAGINVASILADGSISACPNLRSHFIQGNIYKHNLAEVWENGYSQFRDRSWTRTGRCADCSSYPYCEGNGMHLRNPEIPGPLVCHLDLLEKK